MADDSDRVGKHGGKLKTGNAGNKGGQGAPPGQLREWFKMLCEDGEIRQELMDCLMDNGNRNYAAMWRLVLAYGVGMPKQEVSVNKTAQIVHTVILPPLGAEIPEAFPFAHPGPTALQSGESRETREEVADYEIVGTESQADGSLASLENLPGPK